MPSWGDDFKPIQAEFRLTAKGACDYTKRPEVTAALHAVDVRRFRLSAAFAEAPTAPGSTPGALSV
jgi:hypothetical protein